MKEEKTAGLSKKTTIMLAVVFSVLAFFVFRARMNAAQQALIKDYGEKVSVIVAKTDIMPGTQTDKSLLEIREIPSLFVQPGAIKSLDEGVGRVAQIPVKAGEQLLETKLAQSEGGYLSLRVGKEEMRRAITLKLTGEGALAGLVRPGDAIDVIGVFESKTSAEDPNKVNNHAMVIVQAVRVLAVDNRLSDTSIAGDSSAAKFGRVQEGSPADRKWLITVDVDATEAWKLSLAAQVGNLRCVLRYRTNDKPFNYELIDPAQLKKGMKEIKNVDVFGASGKTIWPSGQPAPGQTSYSGE